MESDEGPPGPGPVVVRGAEAADAPQIADIHVRSWQAAYRGMLPDDHLDNLSTDMAQRVQRWQARIKRPEPPELVTLVAVPASDRDAVIGWLNYGPARDDDVGPKVGEVWAINVDPDQWRHGAGARLLDAGAQYLSQHYEQAVLWVLEANVRARSFYQACGWRADGTSRTYGQGAAKAPEVRYRHDLTSYRHDLAAKPNR